ncbi:MAG TPA: hypothetical protein VGM06_01750 [Polyangiaceae bacterium]|jgi:hypothetical protein
MLHADDDLSIQVTQALARFGLKETAKRLQISTESTLRLSTGQRTRGVTRRLALVNAPRLVQDAEVHAS